MGTRKPKAAAAEPVLVDDLPVVIEADVDETDEDQGTAEEAQAGAEDGADDADVDAAADDVDTDADPDASDDDGDLVVTIGDEAAPPPEDAEALQTPAIRAIRQAHRDAVKALRAKDAEIARLRGQGGAAAPADEVIAVGPEPTMNDEDVDFDAEKFAAKYKTWVSQKAKADQQVADRAAAQEAAQRAWSTTLTSYQAEKVALKAADAEDAELAVTEALSVVQQGIILKGIKKRALMILALGRNPKKLKEVAAITDPVDFAIAIGKLEDQLKTTTRKAPIPESRVSGSKPGAAGVEGALARLEAEAERTGDRSKIVAYKRAQKEKARA